MYTEHHMSIYAELNPLYGLIKFKFIFIDTTVQKFGVT